MFSADTPSILNQYIGIRICKYKMANYEVTDYSEKIISAENIRVLSQVD